MWNRPMWLYHWRYGVVFVAGVLLTLLVQVSWHYGCQSDQNGAGPLNLSVSEERTYRVTRVVDGDTLVLENGLHVRYAGVNTPEKGRFVSEPAPLSMQATLRNKELVEGRDVRLRLAQTPVDAYGRVVARITVVDQEGVEVDVEKTLLSEGLGRIMGLGLERDDYDGLKAVQADARAAKRGIWGVAPPRDGTAFPFCAASRGDTYHRSNCSQARRISPANRIAFRTVEEARASGRRPCSRCCGNADVGN